MLTKPGAMMMEPAGKTVLVTGASSGIGLEAALKLAQMDATVVMVARDQNRGEAALAHVRTHSNSQTTSLMLCDFASQASIRKLAESFRSAHARLDILVNNAGTVSATRQLTEDGLEQTFAVNHIGYFLITNLLLDLLTKSAPARIVNVASAGHRHGSIDFDNLQFEKGGYGSMRAYGSSKLANIHFTTELARRLAATGVTANCLHPGTVATNIWSHTPWYLRPFTPLAKLFMVTPTSGADRIVYLATSPEVEGKTGGYYEKDRLATPSGTAEDATVANKLWDVSARLANCSPS